MKEDRRNLKHKYYLLVGQPILLKTEAHRMWAHIVYYALQYLPTHAAHTCIWRDMGEINIQ